LKLFIVVSVGFVLAIGLWIVGRITNTFRLLRRKRAAHEQKFRSGALFFISNLKKPRQFHLISYHAIVPPAGLTILTHRVCGMPGDTLEIKSGVLYVNGQDADKPLPLKHVYKIQTKDSAGIGYDPQTAYTIPPYTDTLYVVLEDNRVEQQQLKAQRYLLPPGLRDDAIFSRYKINWNRDNFGPVKVPPGQWFVLGDDRSNTADSRYLGFIDPSAFVGSVLWR
jgi:signal peptidase I